VKSPSNIDILQSMCQRFSYWQHIHLNSYGESVIEFNPVSVNYGKLTMLFSGCLWLAISFVLIFFYFSFFFHLDYMKNSQE
jgi:hypothetical protein